MNERIEFDAIGLPVDVDAPGFGAGLGRVELSEPPEPDFPVACHLMHDHDPVDCAPEDYRLLDLAERAAGLCDPDAREVLRGLLFELSGLPELDWSPALVASLAERFMGGEPGLPGAVTHHPHVLDQGRAVSGYPDGWAADQLAWMLRRLAQKPLGEVEDLLARIDEDLADADAEATR
jgi:hypothetical protein